MKLYAHPFSSYCQKALIALYENATPFEFRMLAPDDNRAAAELEALWPLKRFPVLVDEGRTVVEASIIIEHLEIHHPGPTRLIPVEPRAALDVRMMDRFFDNYVSTPQGKIVFDSLRAANARDEQGVAEARAMLETAYRWLDEKMAGREWASGAAFSLADCAPPRLPCSMPTGPTRSARRSRTSILIGGGCLRGRPSPVRWTRRDPTATFSRLARPTATERLNQEPIGG